MQKYLDGQAGKMEDGSDYETALKEIRAGLKETHWMWYVFPQLSGVNRGDITEHYALRSLQQAREYYEHPVLGTRLAEICAALLALSTSDPVSIFGLTDAYKLRASMTLFSLAVPEEEIFRTILDKFCLGMQDEKTLELLGLQ